MMRVGRVQFARLHKGQPDRLTLIRWYRAAEGAKDFPYPHCLGYNQWDDLSKEPDDRAIGFLRPVGNWSKGTNPGADGQHFHGNPLWYLYGIPPDELATEPPCGRHVPGGFVVEGAYSVLNLIGEVTFEGSYALGGVPFAGEVTFEGEYRTDRYSGEFVFEGEFGTGEPREEGEFVFEGEYTRATVPISCGDCTEGPMTWSVSVAGFSGDSAVLNGDWSITHVPDSCTWTSITGEDDPDAPHWSVQWDMVNGWRLVGQYNTLNVFAVYLPIDTWNCTGPENETAFDSGNNLGTPPSAITITAG